MSVADMKLADEQAVDLVHPEVWTVAFATPVSSAACASICLTRRAPSIFPALESEPPGRPSYPPASFLTLGYRLNT